VNGNSFDLNYTYQEVASIKWNQFRAFYPVYFSKSTGQSKGYFLLPAAWNAEADAMVMIDGKGQAHFWNGDF